MNRISPAELRQTSHDAGTRSGFRRHGHEQAQTGLTSAGGGATALVIPAARDSYAPSRTGRTRAVTGATRAGHTARLLLKPVDGSPSRQRRGDERFHAQVLKGQLSFWQSTHPILLAELLCVRRARNMNMLFLHQHARCVGPTPNRSV
jgi:hypothetical protein